MALLRNFLKARRVLSSDLPLRFLIDSNLHSIRCTLSDCDPAYAQNDEITITKKQGGFVITREIGRWEPFYGTETEVFKPHSTHSTKSVKTLLNKLLSWDITEVNIINQHGRDARLQIVRIADK